MGELEKKPIWVEDEPLITGLLSNCLDKIDKQQTRLSIKVTPKNTPQLFDYDNPNTGYLWGLVEELRDKYQIFDIRIKRQPLDVEVYVDATLYFNKEQEGLVREWLE